MKIATLLEHSQIFKDWQSADIERVEHHLRVCDLAFQDCPACASILLLIIREEIYVPQSGEWRKDLKN